MRSKQKHQARRRRHQRSRKHVRGTAGRPRLSVYRSNTNVYAQLIDDTTGSTLAAASSREPGVEVGQDGGKIDAARQVGKLIGDRAIEQGITAVVFDRGGNRYAGRVAALAEGARDAGLKF